MDEVAYRQFVELEQDHFWFRGRRAVLFDVLRRALRDAPAGPVLDLGCGVGGMLGPLGRHGRVIGSDVHRAALAHCRRRGHAALAAAEASALPFADGAFALVALFDVLAHVAEDAGALREARRCTRPGGHLVVSAPAYGWLRTGNDRVTHMRRRYTRSALRRLVVAAGWEPVRISYWNTLLFPVIAARLLWARARERWAGGAGASTNLDDRLPRAAHSLLAGVLGFERVLLRATDLPFGHSLVAIARARSVRTPVTANASQTSAASAETLAPASRPGGS